MFVPLDGRVQQKQNRFQWCFTLEVNLPGCEHPYNLRRRCDEALPAIQ